jgi:hypothetical protein
MRRGRDDRRVDEGSAMTPRRLLAAYAVVALLNVVGQFLDGNAESTARR